MSANPNFGIGAVFEKRWLFAKWEKGYIKKFEPSIEYLELYGVIATLLTWGYLIKNCRIIIYSDNSAVVSMINKILWKLHVPVTFAHPQQFDQQLQGIR